MRKDVNIELAKRVKGLPPYLFAEIDRMKNEELQKGVDLIDLSIGDPDLPTFKHIIETIKKSVENPKNHKYSSYTGMLQFREAVSRWYKRRFGVNLDPRTEVLSLIGSKEGIAHIPLAFVNPDDVVLYTSPGYPVYPVSAIFAGGTPYAVPISENNNFMPDFNDIPEHILQKSRLMFLNYPNNPTSACATKEFFGEVINFAYKYNIIVCHDAAYTELYYDGIKPISFLEVDGAKEVGIEFHSLSKTFNMTGWRIGFAVGNSKIISGLGKIKTNIDSGIFQAIQEAGITALETDENILDELRQTYQERRDVLYNGLNKIGLHSVKPMATFYIWTKTPKRFSSFDFTRNLIEKASILTTPGVGFGEAGEGYIRFALTVPVNRLEEVVSRLDKVI